MCSGGWRWRKLRCRCGWMMLSLAAGASCDSGSAFPGRRAELSQTGGQASFHERVRWEHAVASESKMESFAVAHSGSLSHVHTVNFSSSAVDIAREARFIVTIVVAGWITVTVARGLLGSFGNRRE